MCTEHTQPPTVVCKMEAHLEYIATVLAYLAPICTLSRCLLKISALELSRKFIKVALLVGYIKFESNKRCRANVHFSFLFMTMSSGCGLLC